ncbi:MAG: flagellar hook-basal body protein [Firmicutes bacterium]|nr:flagellar hook-basal body protein [Bacillota bacterium]
MRGLYIAEAAMLTQQARLNIISNNLSNQGSPGFKRDGLAQASFGEQLLYCQEPVQPVKHSGIVARPVGSMAHSVAVGAIQTEFTPGAIEETGRDLDFALAEGYFTVQGENGFLFTRNGRFFMDSGAYLVTAEGLPVLGEGGMIPLGGSEFTVDEEGQIYRQGHLQDRLRITFFSPQAQLEKVGDNYFRLLNEQVLLENDVPRLYWRCLESSNVELTAEMVAMLQVRRAFETSQKMLSSYDQLLSRAANELGSLN